MTLYFTPVWVTPAGALATIVEGQAVSIRFDVQEYSKVSCVALQSSVTIGPTYASVFEITVDGQQIGFTVNPPGQNVLFSPLQTSSTVYVYRYPQVTFSLLNGTLPNGLSLTSAGYIMGIPEAINPSFQVFSFTVRASNIEMSCDQVFILTLNGATHSAYLNPVTLPQTITDQATGISYHDLGSLALGQSILYTIDALQQDLVVPAVSIEYLPTLVTTASVVNGLPQGLYLGENFNIIGAVAFSATPARYFFEVYIADPISPSSTIFSILVSATPLSEIDVPLSLEFVTQPGLIGALQSLSPCAFGVEAETNRSGIVYSLDPYSGPLPPGLVLDPTTGNIEGIAGYANATYDLLVRATIGYAFVRAPYSVTVSSALATNDVYNAELLVDMKTSAIIINGCSALVPNAYLFRPNDSNFGLVTRLTVYLISGLSLTTSLENLVVPDATAVANQSYYYVINLITGGYAFSTVVDVFGNPLYDVVYQKLYDPNAGAGGFTVNSSGYVATQTVLDGNAVVAEPVYVNSLENIRSDLTIRLGFATSSAPLAQSPILEPFPPWMKGNYIAGLPLLYAQPGTGSTIVAAFQAATTLAQIGQIISFDKILFNWPEGTDFIQLQ